MVSSPRRLGPFAAALAALYLVFPASATGQAAAGQSVGQAPADIAEASLAEPDAKTLNISTAALRRLLAAGGVVLLDTRPHMEWAIGHIPGALNVAPKPGMPMSVYTSDAAQIDRLVGGGPLPDPHSLLQRPVLRQE